VKKSDSEIGPSGCNEAFHFIFCLRNACPINEKSREAPVSQKSGGGDDISALPAVNIPSGEPARAVVSAVCLCGGGTLTSSSQLLVLGHEPTNCCLIATG
jgi:hypothetical protein